MMVAELCEEAFLRAHIVRWLSIVFQFSRPPASEYSSFDMDGYLLCASAFSPDCRLLDLEGSERPDPMRARQHRQAYRSGTAFKEETIKEPLRGGLDRACRAQKVRIRSKTRTTENKALEGRKISRKIHDRPCLKAAASSSSSLIGTLQIIHLKCQCFLLSDIDIGGICKIYTASNFGRSLCNCSTPCSTIPKGQPNYKMKKHSKTEELICGHLLDKMLVTVSSILVSLNLSSILFPFFCDACGLKSKNGEGPSEPSNQHLHSRTCSWTLRFLASAL